MKITASNLKSITNSKFQDVVLDEGQEWKFSDKRISIIDSKGTVKSFNKKSIKFASVGDTKILSPFLD